MIARILGNLLLAATAVIVSLLVAEGVARYALPDWAPTESDRRFWHHDPLLGWAHRPGEAGYQVHPDFRVRVEINELGMRDGPYPASPAPGKRRILALGDSFTFGHGVERAEIFHELIEARHPNREILNAGVSGYGTDQQWLYYRERGRELDPDVVLLVLHANDFLDSGEAIRYGYAKPLFVLENGALELTGVPVPQTDLSLRFDRFLAERTYLLYRLYHFEEVYEAWKESREDAQTSPVSAPPEPAREAPAPEKRPKRTEAEKQARQAAMTEDEKAEKRARREARERRRAEAARRAALRPSKYDVDMQLTEALLGELQAGVESQGAEFFLVSIPMAERPRQNLQAVTARLGIRHLALDDAFAQVKKPIRFENDPHWTPFGHEVAAAEIERFLVDAGVLDAEPAQ